MNYGTLYLLPSALGESPVNKVIPAYNIEIMRHLNYFIVEEIRTARRFLKKACPDIDISSITFIMHNEHSKPEELSSCIEPLLNRADTGLLSEAGIPCVADPGSEIVRLARHHNIKVVPLVGPSSLLLALMASGFNGQNFVFYGYLPIDKHDRQKKLREIEKAAYNHDQTQIFIEAPYRNLQLFDSIIENCSENMHLCIATDVTTDSEKIEVHSVKDWKGKRPEIYKKPTVFLIYK